MNQEFLFIGHRGTRTDFDENTIGAFKKAIEYGSNYIEFDVRETKDEKFIIFHDTTLDRTTTSSGLLRNFNYEDIREIRTRINNFQIPLLSEVLLGLKGETKFIIELKEENLREKIPKLIKKYSLLEECIFSGRILRDLRFIKKNNPEITTCFNITKGVDLKLNDFLNLGENKKIRFKPDLISLKSTLISVKFIKICHKNGILSLAWDFLQFKDSLYYIKLLIKMGIDGILFDDHKNIPQIRSWIDSI